MPTLNVLSQPDITFKCSVEDWFATSKEKDDWIFLVNQIVRHAYAYRPATLITESPAQWSIGKSLPGPGSLRVGRTRYWVNQIDQCLPDLLTEIVESEDFQRGLLWISSPNNSEENELLSLINHLDTTAINPKSPKIELLLLLDDARQLYWLYPSRDLEIIHGILISFAKEKQWNVTGLDLSSARR